MPNKRNRMVVGGLGVLAAGLIGGALAWAQTPGSPLNSSDAPAPNSPAQLDSAGVTPAPPSAIRPDLPRDAVRGDGRIADLARRASAEGWSEVARPGYNLRGLIPASYFAEFSLNSMIDGSAPTEQVTLASIDSRAQTPRGEGSWPTDGRTWLTVTFYPKASPGFVATPEGKVIDTAEVPTRLGDATATLNHWRRTDGGPDAVIVATQIQLPSGGMVVLSGGTLSPTDDDSVRSLVAMIQNVEVSVK